jgi:hypothetical protein
MGRQGGAKQNRDGSHNLRVWFNGRFHGHRFRTAYSCNVSKTAARIISLEDSHSHQETPTAAKIGYRWTKRNIP